ncbi:adenylate/guanylate cyclase domain-containing protein [Desulfobulbus sp.]|uniref:adenylate/guanylate cyclase domain-containing protein n=1 Tax=Desulfobulbus sp. TaxID=895 RepID=UPI00285262C3|nr:adenylate/guanylate cyclase domain-containing protein [Desulfobulbus sp.]
MGTLMHTAAVLCTTDDRQAEAIAAALPWLQVIRCSDGESARDACQDQEVRLVLIVDESPRIDACRLFGELSGHQPGLAGVLLSAAADTALLHGALEAGFSGVVELPINVLQANRVVHQALERYRLQQENTRLRTLIPLYRLGEQLAAATSEEGILERLLDAVQQQTKASRCSVMLYDQKEQCLRIASARGLYPALVRSLRLQPGDQIAGWVFQQGKPVLLNKEDQGESIFSSLLRQPEIVSSISFPLRICEQNIGVLNISQRETEERFSEADNEMLSILCSQAAVALENLRARQQLTETIRMRTLFEQYVAPEVAELLMAQNADLMELGEIKQTTVLFADIRNFTRLVQQIDLWSLRAFLNEFFHFFTEEVFRHQGTVDKFMGDAVLAVFGAPVKLDHPCLAATRTAMAIKKRFTELRQQWSQHSETFLGVDLGIAVTKGTVFLGNLGSNRRLDYTVIGNEVNIAQRLAAEATACRIYITEAVRRELGGSFEVEELGEIELRGVEKKTRVFSLLEGQERHP